VSKALSLKQAKKLLKVDETKLEKYLRFYNNEILLEPSVEFPHKEALTPTERMMLERYRRVFGMFDIGRTDEWIRSTLQKEYDIEWRQSRNIVNEAYVIYGIVGEADRVGKKRASINFQRTLANLAFKDKNYEAAGKLWEKADKLEGLLDAEAMGLDPDDFKHPSTFIFTDNVNILNQRQKQLDPDE
jgi:hypothetical protein